MALMKVERYKSHTRVCTSGWWWLHERDRKGRSAPCIHTWITWFLISISSSLESRNVCWWLCKIKMPTEDVWFAIMAGTTTAHDFHSGPRCHTEAISVAGINASLHTYCGASCWGWRWVFARPIPWYTVLLYCFQKGWSRNRDWYEY